MPRLHFVGEDFAPYPRQFRQRPASRLRSTYKFKRAGVESLDEGFAMIAWQSVSQRDQRRSTPGCANTDELRNGSHAH
jgi:hypothetical protein